MMGERQAQRIDEEAPAVGFGEAKDDAAKTLRIPGYPGKEAERIHNLTHIPYAPWCKICIEAKGKSDQHVAKGVKEEKEEELPAQRGKIRQRKVE